MNKRYFSLFVISYFFFFAVNAFAIEVKTPYFIEEFSSTYSQNWDIYNNGGQVYQDSLGLHLTSSNNRNFPFLVSKENIFPTEGDYEIEIQYSFPNTSDFGTGFGFGNLKPDYGLTNYGDPDLFRKWVYFYVWQGVNDQHSVYFRNCIDENNCDPSTTRIMAKNPSNTKHVINVRSNANNFVVTSDGFDISNNSLLNSQRRPTVFWIGNPLTLQSSNNWTSINISKISIHKISEKSTEKEKIVVLPGFGGSWDIPAILSGQPGTNWKIPPFVKEYDGIINSLKNSGYVENTNLFIFPYDWRKSLSVLATDLNNFIVSNNLADKKINLVGHSLGGLVARTYLQNYNNPNVQKVVTAGSPHKGIIDAYGLWEGATVWDAVWWQKVLLEIATEVNRQPGETKIQSVQRIAPSIKDLLPTEDYLKQNNHPKPISSMLWKNDFLIARNSELNSFLTKITSGGSKDNSATRKGINIMSPSSEDKAQGLWVDGKPNSTNTFEFGLGDGFVSEKSSVDLFTNKLSLSGGHGETISSLDNIKKILGELKIASDSAVGSSSDSRKTAFVAKLNSPGKISVCLATICDGALGLVFESEKMVIIPGYSEKKYSITVDSGGETGKYKLLVGEINDIGVWKSVVGNLVTTSQKDNYQYDAATDQISADSKTVENLLKVNWNKKPKLSEVYGIRQNILEALDKNIKEANISEFDSNLNKWQTLDYYVASEYSKDKFFNHDGWDLGFKKGRRSKNLQKTPNYYLATLTKFTKEKTVEYEKIPYWQIKLKLDKLIQIAMLKTFIN